MQLIVIGPLLFATKTNRKTSSRTTTLMMEKKEDSTFTATHTFPTGALPTTVRDQPQQSPPPEWQEGGYHDHPGRNPALIWQEIKGHQDDESNQPLSSWWNLGLFHRRPWIESKELHQDRHQLVSMSYPSLFQLIAQVVRRLQDKILTLVKEEEEYGNTPFRRAHPVLASRNNNAAQVKRRWGVPVVVAIPEGPWLPVAVMAVHALNWPFSSSISPSGNKDDQDNNGVGPVNPAPARHDTSGVTSWYTILVPLDPTEGDSRISRVLHELRPALLLTATRSDHDRWQQLIQTLPALTTPQDDNDHHLMPSSSFSSSSAAGGQASQSRIYLTSRPEVVLLPELIQDLPTCPDPGQETWPQTCQHLQNMDAQEPYSCPDLGSLTGQDQDNNRISHIVYTSGTTGMPKGCVSSIQSLLRYLQAKNDMHRVTSASVVLLASSISFDPCFSDILATLSKRATLALAPRSALQQRLGAVLTTLNITHCLCTPTLWGNLFPATLRPVDVLQLRMVALGGERIPPSIVQAWARSCRDVNEIGEHDDDTKAATAADLPGLRLCASYGVTEACVYQTLGEVFCDDPHSSVGQNVGWPFPGIQIRICQEQEASSALERVTGIGYPDGVGEVVLCGSQLDAFSSYFNRPESAFKFWWDAEEQLYCYRTGDRGYVHPVTSQLFIMGRIHGEDGMVKFKGVRVELGEIESAVMDEKAKIVVDCLAEATREEGDHSSSATAIFGYVVLSQECLHELRVQTDIPDSGMYLSPGPLLILLRTRCRRRARVVPSGFIVIPRIPLSPTGKRYRKGLPKLEEAVPSTTICETSLDSIPLSQYGRAGSVVSNQIVDCLNLQPSQEALLTTSGTFAMLGGDSLGATRVVRALYACHHNVFNTRILGGEYGVLDGPFAVHHLLAAPSLGAYVDWLDSHEVCRPRSRSNEKETEEESDANGVQILAITEDTANLYQYLEVENSPNFEEVEEFHLFDALIQAISLDYVQIALSLLEEGANPNFGEHGGRLGKISGRNLRKKIFRSSPLHLACLKGQPQLVEILLLKRAKIASPDASGLYPIHLAATGESRSTYDREHDLRRLKCIQLLLQHGAPLSMKDGNKQSVLHAAARAGHVEVLSYVLPLWKEQCIEDDGKEGSLDWRDQWQRTPVHWAVLNGKIEALRVLLEMGCSADPLKPKHNKRSSAAIESPREMCLRLYGASSNIGQQALALLQKASTGSIKNHLL